MKGWCDLDEDEVREVGEEEEKVEIGEEEVNWMLRRHLGSLERDMSISREQRIKLMSEIDHRWFGC